MALAEASFAIEAKRLGGATKIAKKPPGKGSLYDRLRATVDFLRGDEANRNATDGRNGSSEPAKAPAQGATRGSTQQDVKDNLRAKRGL